MKLKEGHFEARFVAHIPWDYSQEDEQKFLRKFRELIPGLETQRIRQASPHIHAKMQETSWVVQPAIQRKALEVIDIQAGKVVGRMMPSSEKNGKWRVVRYSRIGALGEKISRFVFRKPVATFELGQR